MTATKAVAHTPGPLTVQGANVRTEYGDVVAVAYDPADSQHFTAVTAANARLFAAAPDLLAIAHEVYGERGPRDVSAKVLSATKYAAMTPEFIDETWDFAARHDMHRIAKILAQVEAA